MSYKVILGGRVKKRLKTLDGRLIPRILEKIHLLAENPRPRETLKLVEDGTEGWRVRVGKYRILYTIN
ncbi:type II toxin-antitoxin system RelE/ParE family toxin, partial [bacterium]|nr:type II toxin-antitoxin system RelE/ParE family toxin [bacterium]